MRIQLALLLAVLVIADGLRQTAAAEEPRRPNVVLMMADDQGWGETGYNGHPVLKTPTLDAMAGAGLQLNRFYAGAPVCSPTRASVMTGRHPNRSGVFAPNYCTRPQEITIAQIVKRAGYRTGHFGKWHIGAVKAESPVNPAQFGFDEYLSHDNFFELDPPLSHNGGPPVIHKGESSIIIVDAAIEFMKQVVGERKPFFIVIWFGSPHSPYRGVEEDLAHYPDVESERMRHRFAEITAMDRAIGKFRAAMRSLDVADDTLLWFNSDNGIAPETDGAVYNGGFRGRKGQLYEGGLRVPCVIEWPNVITRGRQSELPVVTSDIFPTLLDLLGLRSPDPDRPIDGISVKKLILDGSMKRRERPIGFWKYGGGGEQINGRWMDPEVTRGTTPTVRNPGIDFRNFKHPVARTENFTGEASWVNDRYKLIVATRAGRAPVALYDLIDDPYETRDIAASHPDLVERMTDELHAWQRSVERSLTGADYQ